MSDYEQCPICKRDMCRRPQAMFCECPEHGLVSDFLALTTPGMPSWEIVAEVRAEQAHFAIHRMAYDARCRINDMWLGLA